MFSYLDVHFIVLKYKRENCHEQFNLKKTASLTWKRTFQVWFKTASMQGKTARIWRAFGGEREFYLNACAAHESFRLNNDVNQLFWWYELFLPGKNEDKVYVNQDESLIDLQILIKC